MSICCTIGTIGSLILEIEASRSQSAHKKDIIDVQLKWKEEQSSKIELMNLSVVAHTCKLSICKSEAGGS